MNYKRKNNKTVIRTEKIAGSFTSITNKIIHDEQLSSNARLLIISILSDAESFDFKRTALRKRLGFTEYKLDNAIKELIKYRYLKKTIKYGSFFHYTISEYGNLNKELDELSKQESKNAKFNEALGDSGNYLASEKFNQDMKLLSDYIAQRLDYIDVKLFKEGSSKVYNRNDVFELKRIQDREVKKNKLKHYKMLEGFVNSKPTFKELRTKILNELKRLIFDEHRKPSEKDVMRIKAGISRQQYINKVKKHGFDYETQLVDSYENPLD